MRDWKNFQKDSECAKCPRFSCTFVPPQVVRDSPIAILGRDPGAEEVRELEPFVGQAGKVLNKLLAKAGFDRAECTILNTVMCHMPGNPPPTPNEIFCCQEKVRDALFEADPQLIITLGEEAARRLIGPVSITVVRGSIQQMSDKAVVGDDMGETGEVYKSGPRKGQPKMAKFPLVIYNETMDLKPVLMTLHPSYIQRTGFADMPLALADFQRAKNFVSPGGLNSVGAGGSVPIADFTFCSPLSLDVETDSDGRLTMIGLSHDGQHSLNLTPQHPYMPHPPGFAALAGFLDNPSNMVIGHNFGFDYKILKQIGITPRCQIWDTMHAAHFLRNDLMKGLEKTASRITNASYWNWKDAYRKGDLDAVTYNHLDSCWPIHIQREQEAQLQITGRLSHFQNVICQLVPCLATMEMNGVPVDEKARSSLREKQLQLVGEMNKQWDEMTGGVNHRNSPGLMEYFYDQKKLKEKHKRDSGKRTLDKDALAALVEKYPNEPALQLLAGIRHAEKVASTYLSFDTRRGMLHPQYNLSGTDTGRLSSGGDEGFNFQNVPRSGELCPRSVDGCVCTDLRGIFRAPPDYVFVVADWSQIEFRIAALLAGEREILDAYAQGPFDIHQTVAERLGIPRKIAKNIVHMSNYGAGPAKVAASAGISVKEATVFVEGFRKLYPNLARWRAEISNSCRKRGYITNPFGRRVYIKINSSTGEVDAPKAIAAVPQSTAGDMMLSVMVDFWKAGLVPSWSVHDELGFLVHEAERGEVVEFVKETMERTFEELGGTGCPVEIGWGKTWKEAK